MRTSSSSVRPLELLDGVHADSAQPLGGGRPDAGDDGDLHRAQQVLLHARRDDDQAVGLVEVAGDLGDQLGGPDADRAGEAAGHLVDPLLELATERADGGDREVGEAGRLEVDEGLVERQRLDERADLAEQRHHRAAGVAVGVEPAGEEGGVGTAPARLGRGHRRVDPERARLVRRRRHDAPAAGAADHDRLAAQRGLVALLHRGEEGVEIHVQDRRLGAHP